MKKVSLKDIARMARAAPSTVSLVLNGKAKQMRISDSLSQHITAMASKMGYQPNHLAVSLRTGKSKIIGLIAESISGHFFGALARIIEEEAEQHEYKVVYCSTDNDPDKGMALIRMLSQRHVDGYLITPSKGMESLVLELIAHDNPVVLLDSYFPGLPVPAVLVDNYHAAALGIAHLIERGYRNIGFVTLDLSLIQLSQRESGYRDTMKAANLEAAAELLLKIAFDCPREIAIGRISDFILSARGMDAIFFATNTLGILGLEGLQALQLNIPGDMAMICFGDHDVFRLYPPGITVISQPAEEIATTAMRMLLNQMKTGTTEIKKGQQQIAASLLERGSVGDLRHKPVGS